MRLFGGFGIGRWFGFEIRIDYSWFLVFFLVVWTFSASEFPRQMPGASQTVYYAAGTAAALLLFLSVLLHELSHASVARTRGVEVESITLFIFGGVAQMGMDARTAADEFLLTAAGPLCSLLLGATFWGLGQAGQAVGAPDAALLVTNTLAVVNVALAVFNMIPGFPLDGGRIFRSAVWWITGDATRATRWATRGGQLFGWLLIGVGLLSLWEGYTLNGMWAVFIGWFLSSAAASSWRQFRARQMLSGVQARRVMAPDPVALQGETSVEEAVRSYFLVRPYGAYPVVVSGRVAGLVGLDEAAEVERERRPHVPVAEIMKPVDEVPTIAPDASLDEVLQRIQSAETDRALVVEHGHLLGVITLGEIGSWLERARKLGVEELDPEEMPVVRRELDPAAGEHAPGDGASSLEGGDHREEWTDGRERG